MIANNTVIAEIEEGEIPAGYLRDSKGRLWPVNQVPEKDKLKDQTVIKIREFAKDLSAQISRFKAHTFDDIVTTQDLLREEYGAKLGGKKGNITMTSFDGLSKVVVQSQDHMEFGPELQIAKELIDECITDWADGAGDEIRAIVNHAFNVDKPGKVNREALFSLRKIEIDDPRWQNAMKAINDSIQVTGSATYIRVYTRRTTEEKWKAVTIDLASA